MATIPAGTEDGGSPSPDSFPVTWQDQAILDLEHDADPWNIQLELSVGTGLDVGHLEEALRAACRRHPMMRARLRRGGALAAGSTWDVTGESDLRVGETDLRRTADVEGELAAFRTGFHSPAFDLEVEGPLRVHVVRRAGSDLVCLSVAHPVVDGVGLLRFLRTVTACAEDRDDSPDSLALLEARRLSRVLRPTSARELLARSTEGGAKLLRAARPPSRVSRQSTDTRRTSGFAHRRITDDVVAPLKARLPGGTTLNDLLLAASMHAIQTWNLQHGERADTVQCFMPVNVRPREWADDMVLNLVSYVSVATRAKQRSTLLETARLVSRQTGSASRVAPSLGTQDLLRLVSPVPLRVKQLMPRLLTLTGHRFVDTAVVSNLGEPAGLTSPDGSEPSEVFFTPPYWSAASVSIGAIRSGGHLHLGVRHRLSDLDAAAGQQFAQLLADTFTAAA